MTSKTTKATRVPATKATKTAVKTTPKKAPAKAASKPAKAAKKAAVKKAPAPIVAAAAAAPAVAPGRETKKSAALVMLRNGATLPEMMEAFGWLRHTTRGFLSILGKTHKLETSKNEAGDRVYKLA